MEFPNELNNLQSLFTFLPHHGNHLKETNNFTSLTIEQKRPPEEESNLKARSHPASCAPYCNECSHKNIAFNINCDKCNDNIFYQKTSISQLFAICRQWTPSIQSNMDLLIREILKRGAHPDDSDAVTGMSLIHYICKSGTDSMGNPDKALKILINLIENHQADIYRVCDINQMNALHYSVSYDVPKLVGYLISQYLSSTLSSSTTSSTKENMGGISVFNPPPSPSSVINQVCAHHRRTPLHLAASNLSLRSARILLGANANLLLKDELGFTALDCIPDDQIIEAKYGNNPKRLLENALELRELLEKATLNLSYELNSENISKTIQIHLSALELEIGSRVLVNNHKTGILRFCGQTKFASGIWAGIELDTPTGKNDGSVDGYRYFTCQPNYGLFTLFEKITKLPTDDHQYSTENDHIRYSHSVVDLNNVRSKIDTGNRKSLCQVPRMLSSSSTSSNMINTDTITIGNRVYLRDKKVGIVRFIGPTEFAEGIWYGIELSRPEGKNNGSVNGIHYFTCQDKYGLFVTYQRIVRVMPNRNSNVTSVTTFESDGTTSDLSIAPSTTSSMDVLPAFGVQRQSTSMSHLSLNQASRLSLTFQRNVSLRRSMSSVKSPRKLILPEKPKRLHLGLTAFVNGQFGIVRYIGTVHFSDGIYLGIELKIPNGKNDGSIEDKRYFTCKPNHGLFVRPQKVTIHGISAAQMLQQDEDDAKRKK